MPKIKLAGYIEVPDHGLEAVELHLPLHIHLTRNEPGCISFEVVQCSANPNRFNVDELFESQEAFDTHQARVKSSEWGLVTKNVVRHYSVTTQFDGET